MNIKVLCGSYLSLWNIFFITDNRGFLEQYGILCLWFIMRRAPNVTSTFRPIRRADGERRRHRFFLSITPTAHYTAGEGDGVFLYLWLLNWTSIRRFKNKRKVCSPAGACSCAQLLHFVPQCPYSNSIIWPWSAACILWATTIAHMVTKPPMGDRKIILDTCLKTCGEVREVCDTEIL